MKDKLYYLSIGIVLWIIYYIWWTKELISFILAIILYGSIFYLFYFLFHKIKKSNKFLIYKLFLINFYKKISLWLLITFIFLWFFAYYQNILYPAKLPQFTITNWNKTVVFQAMSHIWTKDFYKQIKNEVIKYKKDWYVYFYEWVKPGSKENMEAFNKAIWIQFDKDTYKYFSKLYWVENQDNSIFLWLVNNKDYNVDLSIDQIMKLYNKKTKQNLKDKEITNKKVVDLNKEVTKSLAWLNEKQLTIIRFINKAFLNFIMKNDKLQDTIMDNFANKNLFNVILDERNKNLAKEIENSPYKKIFITYGLLHFNWVFNLLKQDDPKWKIIKIKYFYPIK